MRGQERQVRSVICVAPDLLSRVRRRLLFLCPGRAGARDRHDGSRSRALWSGRVLGHDRGRVLADLACVIADGARAISDFRVLADQK